MSIKQAIEALELAIETSYSESTNVTFKAALAALRSMPAEPVAWRTFDGEGQYDYRSFDENENYREAFEARNPNHVGWVEPLYLATPPPAPVLLSDAEINAIYDDTPSGKPGPFILRFARAIEQAVIARGVAK